MDLCLESAIEIKLTSAEILFVKKEILFSQAQPLLIWQYYEKELQQQKNSM